MNRRFIAAGLFLASTATFLLAGRPGSIVTVTGERLSGEVTETRETVTVVRHGVTSVLPRDEVAEIDYATYVERFERALKALSEDDDDGRLLLAREAFDQREYALAQRAVDQAIDINPLNRDALELSRAIANQMALEATTRRAVPTRPPTSRPSAEPEEKRNQRGLNADQINLVRQKELRAGDQVRIQFRNNARKAYVDTRPNLTFRDFSTLTDTAQALQILEHGSEDLRRDVIILTDPSSILSFNRRLHTPILQGCATSQCHGGNAAGNFKLLTGTLDSSTVVTNFYLLMNYRKQNTDNEDSIFAPKEHQMVDRGRARDSLLYQYALPRARANVKHPEVRKWDGIMTNETDRLAVDLVTWMDKELTPISPDYGFEFSLLPSTQPADPGADDAKSGADDAKAGTDDADATTSPVTQPVEDATQPATVPAE